MFNLGSGRRPAGHVGALPVGNLHPAGNSGSAWPFSPGRLGHAPLSPVIVREPPADVWGGNVLLAGRGQRPIVPPDFACSPAAANTCVSVFSCSGRTVCSGPKHEIDGLELRRHSASEPADVNYSNANEVVDLQPPPRPTGPVPHLPQRSRDRGQCCTGRQADKSCDVSNCIDSVLDVDEHEAVTQINMRVAAQSMSRRPDSPHRGR